MTFYKKKYDSRLRMCEKSSTSRAPTSPLKRARPPRNYVREMQPILQTLTPFLKTWLCHLIEPSPIHSLVSKLPPSTLVLTQLIDKSIFSKKYVRLLAYVHFLLYLCRIFLFHYETYLNIRSCHRFWHGFVCY